MPLVKLQFKSGVNRETTSYSNEGGWFDIDKVRFRFGFPEKIGGWIKSSATSFLGTCRALHQWTSLAGDRYIGVGTNLKYYINEGGGYNDITPIRETTDAGDVTFSASANTLSADISAATNSIPLTSTSGFPESGRIKIDSEIITYAGLSGNNLIGCIRGVNGTSAATHSSSAVVTCATIIVTDLNHGALENDFVTFSDAVSLGGAITADILNQEYQITVIISTSEYQIEARTVSTITSITTSSGVNPTYVFASSSDSGDGGSSTIGAYQINTGLDTTIIGNGWGAGTWGRGTWGSGADISASGQSLRIWTHDNFGEDLLMNVRDGGIYYWDKTSGLTQRAVALESLPGADKTPTVAKQVMVSNNDRHTLMFGCDSEFEPGIQDPLLIRFSSQESLTDWGAKRTNTAGDLRIGSGSEIITAIETRQQIIVFTDASLHAMQYIGPPFTFGIDLISENLTIASPLAVTSAQDSIFWMGQSEFYMYNGAVNRIPCEVRDYVFSNINNDQLTKVHASTNTAFSEVWWFYPSASSDECDSYVVFNYQEQTWYYGTMTRTAWLDRGIEKFPIAANTDNILYYQENGFDDGSTNPASPINAYIESSQMSIVNGDAFAFIRRVIPDITFRNSTAASPRITFEMQTREFPGAAYTQTDTGAVIKTASAPVEQFTNELFFRLRGRSFAFKVSSDEMGVAWRLGTPRADVRQDGQR
jgi:hypothetical protein